MKIDKIRINDEAGVLASTKQHYIAERGKILSSMAKLINNATDSTSKRELILWVEKLVTAEESLIIIEKYFEEGSTRSFFANLEFFFQPGVFFTICWIF